MVWPVNGSRPVVGSSMSMISGSSTRALASDALFTMPPLIWKGISPQSRASRPVPAQHDLLPDFLLTQFCFSLKGTRRCRRWSWNQRELRSEKESRAISHADQFCASEAANVLILHQDPSLVRTEQACHVLQEHALAITAPPIRARSSPCSTSSSPL